MRPYPVRFILAIPTFSILFAVDALAAIPLPPLEPGPARSWQADVQVSTYSRVNTRNGNMFTVIPIVSWSGLGPDMKFSLYHNSANWNQTANDTKNVGFFLGSGWSVSYSDRLIINSSTSATVIWADGTRDAWTLYNGVGTPPAGVFDKLQRDAVFTQVWRLTRKDQMVYEFHDSYADGVIRLVRILDAAGNQTLVTYEVTTHNSEDIIRIKTIGAAGREIEFHYDTTEGDTWGRLVSIEHPGEINLPETGIETNARFWTFTYDDNVDGSGWMTSIADAMNNLNIFTYIKDCTSQGLDGQCLAYTWRGRLASVSDKTASTPGDDYFYTYHTLGQPVGRVNRVYDPTSGSPTSALYQRFTYAVYTPGYYNCKHYDRRNHYTTYYYNIDSYSNIYPDGNLNAIETPNLVTRIFYYDSDHNLTEYWHNGFGLLRYDQYDSNGNITSSEDFFSNDETWTYDAFNNVTSHTDRLGYTTRYYYDESNESFEGTCDNVAVSCGFECDGGAHDGDPCEWDGDCPSGTCEAIQSDCKVCLGGVNIGDLCTGAGDCPGSTCDQGTCDVTVNPPRASTLLTRIVQPNSSGNPPASQLPGEEGSYPVTRLNYYLSGTSGGGQLKEVIDPNGVWTGFDYDLWGQENLYSEGQQNGVITLQRVSATDARGYPASHYWVRHASSAMRGGDTTVYMAGGVGSSDDSGNSTGGSCTEPAARAGGPIALSIPASFPNLPCSAPAFPYACATFSSADYTPKGELLSMPLTVAPEGCGDLQTERDRTYTNTYHALGMPDFTGIESNEFDVDDPIERGFSHDYDLGAGQYTRTGPDGLETYVEFDDDNQMTYLRRGPANDPVMEATYVYLSGTNLVQSVTFSNGSKVEYTYNTTPNRVSSIKHYKPGSSTTLQQDFTYTADDLPETIIESGTATGSSTIGFGYDHLRRLVTESRTGTGAYDLEYVYDDGGNRTAKIDYTNDRLTEYHYDIEDPSVYGSNNNRLEYYEVYDTSGQSQALLSTTWYYYEDDDGLDYGNPTRIVTKAEASADYESVRFGYAMNGRTVSFVVGEQWEWDGNTANCPTDWAIIFAREFRYDGARARYLVRELNTAQLELGNIVTTSETWTDYDGDEAYGDYSLTAGNSPTLTESKSFQPGLATVESWTNAGDTSTYYHAVDHIGSVRGWSDNSGFPVLPAAYTAFGEIVYESGGHHRYGYIGSFGYQQDEEMPFLHVGNRYYDPATGRFLQRDPIGIYGGLNVYSYVDSRATTTVDPSGLYRSELRPDEKQIKEEKEKKEPRSQSDKDIQDELDEVNDLIKWTKRGLRLAIGYLCGGPKAAAGAGAIGEVNGL